MEGYKSVQDDAFSLGLTFREVLDLSEENLGMFLKHVNREEIIAWLSWNDPNGVYSDKCSLSEFGSILSKIEGIEIIKKQILESRGELYDRRRNH